MGIELAIRTLQWRRWPVGINMRTSQKRGGQSGSYITMCVMATGDRTHYTYISMERIGGGERTNCAYIIIERMPSEDRTHYAYITKKGMATIDGIANGDRTH